MNKNLYYHMVEAYLDWHDLLEHWDAGTNHMSEEFSHWISLRTIKWAEYVKRRDVYLKSLAAEPRLMALN